MRLENVLAVFPPPAVPRLRCVELEDSNAAVAIGCQQQTQQNTAPPEPKIIIEYK